MCEKKSTEKKLGKEIIEKNDTPRTLFIECIIIIIIAFLVLTVGLDNDLLFECRVNRSLWIFFIRQKASRCIVVLGRCFEPATTTSTSFLFCIVVVILGRPRLLRVAARRALLHW